MAVEKTNLRLGLALSESGSKSRAIPFHIITKAWDRDYRSRTRACVNTRRALRTCTVQGEHCQMQKSIKLLRLDSSSS